MYVKVLHQNDNNIHIVSGIQNVAFYKQTADYEELRRRAESADLVVYNDETPREEGVIIGTLDLTLDGGRRMTILFDAVAFLCNEQGKAVERFVLER